MTASRAVELVAAALGDVLEMDPAVFRPDTPLADVGADSLVRVGFADAVESRISREFGTHIEISDDVLADAVNVSDLADHLSSLMSSVTDKESI